MASENATQCKLCGFALTNDWLLDDGLWQIGALPGASQPGWIMMQLRRHAGELDDLREAELSAYSTLAAKLTRALRAATKAQVIYMIKVGEYVPAHFHVQFVARGDDVLPEDRGLGLMANRDKYSNPTAAAAVAEQVRKYLELDA
jgi:diadenosine tetraphosphate (Ap4A) HIT family hydrolase